LTPQHNGSTTTAEDPTIAPKQTCPWPQDDAQMVEYHDTEWGRPLHNDQKLFEFLVLDAFQAGLSWSTVLHKRENFRKAFKKFDPKKVARFGKPDIQRLLADPGIIRNRLKIEATVKNAKAFLKIQKEFGTFDKYIWSFVGHRTVDNKWENISQIPASSVQSDDMSKDLKARGFSFVGTTICYAFMQAAGMVNDHLVTCFRYQELKIT
jgi:DNA-3-methyladenine glycosylase I